MVETQQRKQTGLIVESKRNKGKFAASSSFFLLLICIALKNFGSNERQADL